MSLSHVYLHVSYQTAITTTTTHKKRLEEQRGKQSCILNITAGHGAHGDRHFDSFFVGAYNRIHVGVSLHHTHSPFFVVVVVKRWEFGAR